MKPVKITPLEKEVLMSVACSDHSSDQGGYICYTDWSYFNLPMNIVRGVISSLIKKGILHFTRGGDGMGSYVSVSMNHTTGEGWKSDPNLFGNDPFGDEGRFGFKYINLEWVE